MKPIQQPKEQRLKVKKVLELLNREMKIKYPPGSNIIFLAVYHKDERPPMVSCMSCDKMEEKYPLKKTIKNPPEWQNMSYAEAEKVAAMFDESLFVNILFG